MGTKTDVYQIDTKSSLGGLKAANAALRKQGQALSQLAGKSKLLNTSVGKLKAGLGRVGAATRKAGAGVRSLIGKLKGLRKAGGLAKSAMKGLAMGLGSLLAGGLMAVVGAVRLLPGLFSAMRTATDGAADSASGAAGNLDDAADAAGAAASEFSKSADETEAAGRKIKGVFGAFGQVGEGFIQKQGKTFDAVKATAEAAVDAAGDAGTAIDAVDSAVGGATSRLSRFGSAMDRIGAAWKKAKNTILKAIAEALTPALEALADLMESPEFQEFVKLLAEDLADAAASIAKWFIDDVVPAIQSFLVEVNKAGGPVEYLKQKWEELKTRIQEILAVLRGDADSTATGWREALLKVVQFYVNSWRIMLELVGKFIKGAIELFWKLTEIMPKIIEAIKKGIGTIKALFITALLLLKTAIAIYFVVPFLRAIEDVKNLWESLSEFVKTAVENIFSNIRERFGVDVPGVFSRMIESVKGMWTSLKTSVVTVLMGLSTAAQNILAGMANVIRGVFNSILGPLENAINGVIRILGPFINLYNSVAEATGGHKLDIIGNISLPRLAKGAIVSSPIAAIVGDNPTSPEVVAPLHDLVDIMRRALADVGGTQVLVTVSVAPGGFATPEEAGQRVADEFVRAARARGIRL